MIRFFFPILIAIALLTGAFFLGKGYGSSKELAKCQQTQISSQNEGIKTIVKSTQSREKINALPIDAVWNELFKRYCPDCK